MLIKELRDAMDMPNASARELVDAIIAMVCAEDSIRRPPENAVPLARHRNTRFSASSLALGFPVSLHRPQLENVSSGDHTSSRAACSGVTHRSNTTPEKHATVSM